jgi:hypothetical protein
MYLYLLCGFNGKWLKNLSKCFVCILFFLRYVENGIVLKDYIMCFS